MPYVGFLVSSDDWALRLSASSNVVDGSTNPFDYATALLNADFYCMRQWSVQERFFNDDSIERQCEDYICTPGPIGIVAIFNIVLIPVSVIFSWVISAPEHPMFRVRCWPSAQISEETTKTEAIEHQEHVCTYICRSLHWAHQYKRHCSIYCDTGKSGAGRITTIWRRRIRGLGILDLYYSQMQERFCCNIGPFDVIFKELCLHFWSLSVLGNWDIVLRNRCDQLSLSCLSSYNIMIAIVVNSRVYFVSNKGSS